MIRYSMNTHSYNKNVKNEAERHKTIVSYDSVVNPEKCKYLDYLDVNDVVPLKIDGSKYYDDKICLKEQAIESLTDDEKNNYCLKV